MIIMSMNQYKLVFVKINETNGAFANLTVEGEKMQMTKISS